MQQTPADLQLNLPFSGICSFILSFILSIYCTVKLCFPLKVLFFKVCLSVLLFIKCKQLHYVCCSGQYSGPKIYENTNVTLLKIYECLAMDNQKSAIYKKKNRYTVKSTHLYENVCVKVEPSKFKLNPILWIHTVDRCVIEDLKVILELSCAMHCICILKSLVWLNIWWVMLVADVMNI